ncbi:MAG: sigma-70 family RNA polymerase sigma factor [Pirellulales bacterium]|nr:sigma-70 family RNA polymerase sigma factor [Pirellulales bacterium]
MPSEPMQHRPDDQALALRAQKGCIDSFEELLRRHQVPLLHFLKRFANETEAEDILQETFIRAYRNLDRYHPRWRFSTWLFTIARRLAANSRKRQIPEENNTTEIESLPSGSLDPEATLEAEENKHKLWDIAADVLTPDQHTALWLYYVEDMPVKEIASVLGRYVPATKMMLHRARQKLMPALQSTELKHE